VTAPAEEPQGPAVPPELVVVAESMLALAAWEEATLAAVAPLRAQITALTRTLAALWVKLFGDLDARVEPATDTGPAAAVDGTADDDAPVVRRDPRLDQVIAAAVDGLDAVDHRVSSTLTERARGAAHLSAERTAVELDEFRAWVTDVDITLPDLPDPADLDLGEVIPGVLDVLDDNLRAQLDRAADRARQLAEADAEQASWDSFVDVLAQAQHAATSAERAARWSTTAAADHGTTAVVQAATVAPADGSGAFSGSLADWVERMWIAERDACVHCLAMAGALTEGGSYPVPESSFGVPTLAVWPEDSLLWGPPRHPNCRCRSCAWLGQLPGYVGPDLPSVLRREAERSILSGWRVATEREPIRLAAARHLLANSAGQPASVRDRARKAIARGAFDVFPREPPRAVTT